MDLTVRTIRVQNNLLTRLLKLLCIVVSEYIHGDTYVGSVIIEVLHLVLN